MQRHPLRVPLLAGTLLAVLAGCTGQAQAPSPGDVAAPQSLEDGEYFGFLTDVDAAGGTITFDPATWVVADDEPNGYRIENDAIDDEVVPVGTAAEIDVLLHGGDPATAATVDLDGLEDWFLDPASGEDVAFDVTMTGGEATALAFRYRP